MSLEHFWFDLSSWASQFLPLGAAVDSPRLDEERIEALLGSNPTLLREVSVKGYEAGDFDFLVNEEREKLAIGVEQFRRFKAVIKDDRPSSKSHIQEGIDGLRKILEVIRPDKYPDLESFILGKTIEKELRPELPEWVREMVFETGTDSNGLPALWIWVEVDDSAAREKALLRNFLSIRKLLDRAVHKICPQRWLYVRIRTSSEQRPLAKTSKR